MAFTSPRTWVVGEIVTAALMNTHVRDNLNYLKGVGQVPTTQSGLIIDNSLGSEYLKLPLLSTAETGTVLAAEGQIAHDEQTHRIKFHNGTAVKSVVSTADVDDTPANGADTDPVSSNWAYDFINTLTTQADLPYATAAGTWTRLAKGTAGQILQMNGGATAPQWASVAGVINTGNYTGDGNTNRAIAHGLGITPKFVFIVNSSTWAEFSILARNDTALINYTALTFGAVAVTAKDATNFYVGDAVNHFANGNLITYDWVAWG